MNDLWVHSSNSPDPDMDRQIKEIVEANGGKWFGSGMHFLDSSEGRDNSFSFTTLGDFESAVGGLNQAFELEWMRSTGDEGNYSCHYRVASHRRL